MQFWSTTIVEKVSEAVLLTHKLNSRTDSNELLGHKLLSKKGNGRMVPTKRIIKTNKFLEQSTNEQWANKD